MSKIVFEKLTVKETGKVRGGVKISIGNPAGNDKCQHPGIPEPGCIKPGTISGFDCKTMVFPSESIKTLR